MEISILLIKQIMQLFLIMFLGYLIVKLGILKTEDSKIISTVVLYIIMPCCILNSFQVDYAPETVHNLALSFVAVAIVYAVWILVSPLFRKVFHLNEVEEVSVLYTNSGNLIVPIVMGIFGEDWILYTSAMISIQGFLLWTHGKHIMCNEKGFNIKNILSVNTIAVMIGAVLFITGYRFPDVVANTISMLGTCIGPVPMIVTGMLMAGISFKEILMNKRMYLIIVLRLIVFPLIALAILKYSPLITFFADNGQTILLIVLLGCLTCSAASITQMAQVYGADAKYAGAINVVTTLLCIVTMPIIVMLYYL